MSVNTDVHHGITENLPSGIMTMLFECKYLKRVKKTINVTFEQDSSTAFLITPAANISDKSKSMIEHGQLLLL